MKPYGGLYVVELGSRAALAACGRVLADLGATVFVVEPPTSAASRAGKWRDRATAVAGKRSVLCDPSSARDVDALASLIASCDVVLTSSDVDGAALTSTSIVEAIAACSITCDVTAFGASGPRAGSVADEAEIQALTGLVETTGRADGEAQPIGVPFVETSAGLYAAGAIAVAWHVLRRDGVGDRIDIALYDVAFNALTTFVPSHFAGRAPMRLGNGHGMAVPWNAYPARDGWVLICSANDAQWQRLARRIDAALPDDPRYSTLLQRVAARDAVDALVADWTRAHDRDAIVATLTDARVASGAIVPLAALEAEPNLAWRRTVARVVDPRTGSSVRVPNPLIRFAPLGGDDAADDVESPTIPLPDDGAALARDVAASRTRRAASTVPASSSRPLAGINVVEIGQFTAAPLAARHLSSFGACVVKVEPEAGESARDWPPLREGTSHFFVISNGEKHSVALDLRDDGGKAALCAMLRDADVLVENLKPGSLASLGFGDDALAAINSRLVHCAISGFGSRSVYAGRPAFDTVIQAMSGMMDATRDGDLPLKSGISAADILGGQVAFVAILAALARREQDGRGATIDLSMQDIGAWSTQTLWNVARVEARRDVVARTVAAACDDPQTHARDLVVRRVDADGVAWELLGSPMKLARSTASIGAPIGRPVPNGQAPWVQRPD